MLDKLFIFVDRYEFKTLQCVCVGGWVGGRVCVCVCVCGWVGVGVGWCVCVCGGGGGVYKPLYIDIYYDRHYFPEAIKLL